MDDLYFVVKDKDFVTSNEEEQIEWLRFKTGKIWPAYLKYDGYVIFAIRDNQILGWAFVFNYPKEKTKTFYVYVRKDSRREGIGTRIFDIATNQNDGEAFYVSKWDDRSTSFYEKIEA